MVHKNGKRWVILFFVAAILTISAGSVIASNPIVVNFDDLNLWDNEYGYTLSGTNYAGLTWEWGNNLGNGTGE